MNYVTEVGEYVVDVNISAGSDPGDVSITINGTEIIRIEVADDKIKTRDASNALIDSGLKVLKGGVTGYHVG